MISFSYTQDCAVYGDAPTNATCRLCKEAFLDETPGQTRVYCESCEDYYDAQMMSDIMMDDMQERSK